MNGGALGLITIGAILAFAVRDQVDQVDLPVVGWILMAVGALGYVAGLVADVSQAIAKKKQS